MLLRLARRHRLQGDTVGAQALFAYAQCEAWRAGRVDLLAAAIRDASPVRPGR